jgi:tripartite motif-containing protein 71
MEGAESYGDVRAQGVGPIRAQIHSRRVGKPGFPGVRRALRLASLVVSLGLIAAGASPALASVQFTRQWAGAPEFDHPWGAAIEASGNAYVADTNNSRIEEVDSDGNLLRTWGSFGTAEGQFRDPAGIALDASGNVYVADLTNQRIDEFSPTGTFLRTWGFGVSDGGNSFQVCTAGCQAGVAGSGDGQFNNPRDIAFDSSGNAYVVDAANHRIQEFDSTVSRSFVTKWGSSGGGSGQFAGPFAITVDSSDDVYVTDLLNHRVQEFTPPAVSTDPPDFFRMWGKGVNQTSGGDICTAASGNTCQAGTLGAAEGQFNGPRGVAVDSTGSLYVTDSGNARVEKFDSTGNFAGVWGWGVSDGSQEYEICTVNCQAGHSGSGVPGEFDVPFGIATSSQDNVYVVDTNNNRVQVFDSGGSPFVSVANRFGGAGSDGQFAGPAGLATDPSDNLVVADTLNNRVFKFNGDGARLGSLAGSGSGPQQVMGPEGVATDSSGNVYVADSANQRIEKFDSAGAFVVMWGKGVDQTSGGNVCDGSAGHVCGPGGAGSGDGEFNEPSGVTVDPSGNVYVADLNNDRIEKFTSSGAYLAQWGTHGSGDGQIDVAAGVAADSAGNVYVVDYANHRIDVFSDTGTFKRAWGWGVQNGSNALEVCTSGCQAGLSGLGDGEFINMSSVATDAFNNVYVPDCSRDDIQVFRPTGTFVKKWGSSGAGNGQFDCPDYVATDGSLIYTSDFEGQRIEKFTETDTTLPDTSIDDGPPSRTNDATPSFDFSSTEPGGPDFECRIDSSAENAYVSCSSGFTTAPLADGSHTFDVRAIDPAGNPDGSPASSTFTVDTTPPDTTIATGSSGPTRDATPTYTFTATEGNSTFRCKVDSHAFAPCSSPKTTGRLADGLHTFYVRATDLAGNPDLSAAHRSVKVDTHRPASKASAPAATRRSPFNVTYTASDPSPSTKVARVELWARRPGQSGFSKVAVDTTPNATRVFSYKAAAGAGTYRFFTRAKDRAGNYETQPSTPDASTSYNP